jgi:AcrR family transcriptional regulator
MSQKSTKKRVSKDEWLEVALNALEREGVKGVRIEALARTLGISKSGFYWHFRDRKDLLTQMLEYWEYAFTDVVMQSLSQSPLPPREKLLEAMHMVDAHKLTKFDLSIRSWAIHDSRVLNIVKRVDRKRLEFVKTLLAKSGFRGEDLEARARLMMVFNSMVHTMQLGVPKKDYSKLLDRCNQFLLEQ